MKYIEPLARLIAQLSKLPSVGEKTAARYAYAILNSPAEEVNELVDAIRDVKQNVHFAKFAAITPKTRFVIFAKLANQA